MQDASIQWSLKVTKSHQSSSSFVFWCAVQFWLNTHSCSDHLSLFRSGYTRSSFLSCCCFQKAAYSRLLPAFITKVKIVFLEWLPGKMDVARFKTLDLAGSPNAVWSFNLTGNDWDCESHLRHDGEVHLPSADGGRPAAACGRLFPGWCLTEKQINVKKKKKKSASVWNAFSLFITMRCSFPENG